MIRINIPGFYNTDSGGPRWGDSQIIDDGKYYEVIDGYCGVGTTRLIKRLKAMKCKNPRLYITHAHHDHYYGIRAIIRDDYFEPKGLYLYDPDSLTAHNSEIKSEINALKNIVREAKAKNIPVTYLENGDTLQHGDIKFTVYREQPGYSGNSDAYINDGSLCFFYPELSYFTSGDGPKEIGTLCEKYKIKPVMIKIPHHGNNCPRVQAKKLWALGTRFCWDNDFNTSITDFLETGREDCKAVGMKYFNTHGDLNFIACSGSMVIYKDSSVYKYKCSYKGKTRLKAPSATDIINILKGKYGNGNTRITGLIDAGVYPSAAQKAINQILEIVK